MSQAVLADSLWWRKALSQEAEERGRDVLASGFLILLQAVDERSDQCLAINSFLGKHNRLSLRRDMSRAKSMKVSIRETECGDTARKIFERIMPAVAVRALVGHDLARILAPASRSSPEDA